ncbi:tyrosine-type recombinase/integrase [Paenibacillus farraposensis]|uniref:tyrosine-type recombinase/integrase n=1 Tax=Paenibacillus farraposensis TaxID=2807095 RepID=UPI00360DC383
MDYQRSEVVGQSGQQNFTRTLKKHGMRRIRYHDLRHSCASLLLANGISMKEIQEGLGHSIQFQGIFSANHERGFRKKCSYYVLIWTVIYRLTHSLSPICPQ